MSLPTAYYLDPQVTMYLGDCRDVMAAMPDNSVDSIVTDPPYEIGFMGKQWDGKGIAYDVDLWREAYRVLKPGGYLLALGGSRTYHRMAVAIEDAGFMLHPMLGWVTGQGFPKATNLGKQFDKQAGAERGVIGIRKGAGMSPNKPSGAGTFRDDNWQPESSDLPETKPTTPEAQQWDGWYYGRQSMKPALEPCALAQKPLSHWQELGKIAIDISNYLGAIQCLSFSHVAIAEWSSTVDVDNQNPPTVSALVNAYALSVARSNDESVKMDMFSSPEAASMCLNIASLWNGIWDVLSNHGSTFTTGTETKLTTALTTLKCLLSANMPASSIQAVTNPVGQQFSATTAGHPSNDSRSYWQSIQKHIATALVTSPAAQTLGTDELVSNAAASLSAVIRSVNSVLESAMTTIDAQPSTSLEPICMAQKPPEGRMTDNVRAWDTGAVNVDACRVGADEELGRKSLTGPYTSERTWNTSKTPAQDSTGLVAGRWPPNLILDDHAAALLDAEVGELTSGKAAAGGHRRNTDKLRDVYSAFEGQTVEATALYGDTGGSSRFFPVFPSGLPIMYQAKAPTKERTLPDGSRNGHPTQKPLGLMRWLVRLVTPPGGTVLDPFYGSGTTGCAARLESFKAIGIEQHDPYLEIAVQRLAQQVLPLEMVS